jgi:hypothetical protein
MLKNLFKRVWDILVSPSRTWEAISQDSNEGKRYLTRFFYPLVALAALTAFLSPFIKGYEELEIGAIVSVGVQLFVVSFISVFFGFFLTARLLNYSSVRWFKMNSDNRKSEMLTAYASTPVLVVSILTRLLSDFFFVKILFFYVIVLVWEATKQFYTVEEAKRGRFTALASILILLMPFVVEQLFLLILPGLK